MPVPEEDIPLYRELTRLFSNVKSMGDWGPVFWAALHYETFMSVPDEIGHERRQQLTEYYQVHVPASLPCGKCAYHFKWAALGRDPSAPAPEDWHAEENGVYPHTETKAKLVRWLVDVHNKVNKRTGKPEIAAEEAVRRFAKPGDVASAIREATSPVGGPQQAAQTEAATAGAGIVLWIVIIVLILVVIGLGAGLAYSRSGSTASSRGTGLRGGDI